MRYPAYALRFGVAWHVFSRGGPAIPPILQRSAPGHPAPPPPELPPTTQVSDKYQQPFLSTKWVSENDDTVEQPMGDIDITFVH